jgi:small subunit ribosomal protein S21
LKARFVGGRPGIRAQELESTVDALSPSGYPYRPIFKATCIERRGNNYMPEVTVRKGEPIDRALKRLKSKLETEGIMDEVRRLRAFETPTQKSRRKAKANAKRAKAKQQRFHLA